MKKKIKRLLVMATVVIIALGNISCEFFSLHITYVPPETEWDGRFLYYLGRAKEYYYILGTEPELGKKSETLDKLYLPSHYKGLPVHRYSCRFGGKDKETKKIVEYEFGIDITPVKEVYLNYEGGGIASVLGEYNYEKVVAPHIGYLIFNYLPTNAPHLTVYIPEYGYEDSIKQTLRDLNYIGWTLKVNDAYSFSIYNDKEELNRTIYKANTAYMFNYKDAPNQNYYFINEFERGGLIEDTPFEPYREGYTFLGWYKDPECSTKWDFEKDTLPEPTYDENGDLQFIETRLYAKWEENKGE